MKRITLPFIAILTTSLTAEVENEIPIGLEAVTGIRSEYIHRGFKLSDRVLDFQLEGEISLKDDKFLGYGAWFATGTGNQDFSESGIKLTYTQDFETWQFYSSLSYRVQRNSPLDSGLEVLTRFSYFFAESAQSSHSVAGILSYDSGAEGFYGALEYENYTAINKDSFISVNSGVSIVSDYYNRDGFNDLYARLSYTYNITNQVSISPFAGVSLQLEDANGSDYLYGGLWFEVSF